MKLLTSLGFILLATLPGWAQETLRLKGRVGLARAVKAENRAMKNTHYIVQFASEPGIAERQELERRGFAVLQYVPDAAFMISSRTLPDLSGLDVISVSTMSVSDKISPLLE